MHSVFEQITADYPLRIFYKNGELVFHVLSKEDVKFCKTCTGSMFVKIACSENSFLSMLLDFSVHPKWLEWLDSQIGEVPKVTKCKRRKK